VHVRAIPALEKSPLVLLAQRKICPLVLLVLQVQVQGEDVAANSSIGEYSKYYKFS